MYASLRGTRIFFDVDGASHRIAGGAIAQRPTAFLVHGGPGADHSSMKPRFAALAKSMQLVYFDHRGNGRSARGDPESWTLDEHVEDMEALRQHLGLGPIVSIGMSYGGVVAQAHAARYPDAVSDLVLGVTYSHCGYAERACHFAKQRGTAAQIEMCEALFGGKIDSADKMQAFMTVMGPLYSQRFDPDHFSGFGPAILEPRAQNLAHGPGGFLRDFDLRSELGGITARTLIIAGRHDWICAPEFSEEIQDLIPNSRIEIFEQSSHLIGMDEPKRLIETIHEFLGVARQAA